MLEKILSNKERTFNIYGNNINVDSIMVYDNGLFESHFYKPDSLHEMRSLSKVLVALAIGIAIDRNILSLDTYVYPIFKDLVKIKKENIRKIQKWQIKHLLTYSCGYEKQMFSERFIKDINPKEYLSYVLNYDLVYEAGERYVYNNAESFLLSVVFQELTGINMGKFIEDEIFQPLNIKNYIWENYDKYCPGGTGLYISGKNLFEIGKLLLNKGIFCGRQIVSSKFIENMCKSQIETPYAIKPERVLPKYGVGYIMHISRDGYCFKDGANGQYLIINFAKNQLITILSSEEDMGNVTELLRGII